MNASNCGEINAVLLNATPLGVLPWCCRFSIAWWSWLERAIAPGHIWTVPLLDVAVLRTNA